MISMDEEEREREREREERREKNDQHIHDVIDIQERRSEDICHAHAHT